VTRHYVDQILTKRSKVMPTSLEEFHEWFRVELHLLPEEARAAVYRALETRSPRQIFIELDALRTASGLPSKWNRVLTDYYDRFF
jgi:hypothetical protein